MTRTRLSALSTTAALAVAGGLLTAAPASAAVTCTSPVWTAQYYANTSFSGTPKLTACDNAIAENYGTGDPAGVTLPRDNFSVRWSVTRDFGSGGPFRFSAATQDGVRVYVDGVRKIDLWRNVSTTQYKTVDLSVPSGRHTIRVDYVAWTGNANVSFSYAPRTTATVDTVNPLAPTGLAAVYEGDPSKTPLRWFANKEMDLAGYRVYRRLSTASWAKVSGTSLLTSPYFVDAPPLTGQTFLYEVRAVDKAGRESAGSLDVPVPTVDLTGPAAPTGVTVVGDAWWATLGWQGVADAATYEVYAASASTGPFELLGTTTTTSYRTTAPENTLRYYRVRALDARGNPSAYSATITGDGVDRTPPKSPTDLGAVVDVGSTEVYWKQPDGFSEDFSNGGRYHVYRSPGTSLDPAALTRVNCSENSDFTSTGGLCHDLEMARGVYYTYAVAAVDPAGNESALSAPFVVRTGDRVAPAPVTGLTATPRTDGMLLKWSASTEDDLARYVAYRGVRKADGTVYWSVAHCTDGTDDPLAILCAGLPDGETDLYAVVAKDRWGNALYPATSADAATVTATELDVRPSVTVVKEGALNGASGGGLSWTNLPSFWWRCTDAALCGPITEYRLNRWNPATARYETVQTTGPVASEGRFEDRTAVPGNTYFYTFEALRADGTTVARYVWDFVYADAV
ncbi:PA14 domain-containing protein [Streptomyces sp. NPDC059875]|uniref:PA14 domain-containing protein n=1 Tax=unclassified Streptomyces TaxID=2593676 RepID=UPI00365D894A